MWTAKPPQEMSADEYFIYRVQLLAAQYNIMVEIDAQKRTVNFLTNDEVLINTITFELEKEFG